MRRRSSRLAKLTGDLAEISGKSAEERLKEEKAAKALAEAQKLVTSAIAASGTEYDKLSRKYAEQAAALDLVTAAGELSARQQYDMQEALRATATAIEEIRSKPFEIIEGLEQTLEQQLKLNEAIRASSGLLDMVEANFALEEKIKEAREEQEKLGKEAGLYESTIRANADAAEDLVRQIDAAERSTALLKGEATAAAAAFKAVAGAVSSVQSEIDGINVSNLRAGAELAALEAGATRERAKAAGELAAAQAQLKPAIESSTPGDNLIAAKAMADLAKSTEEKLALDERIKAIYDFAQACLWRRKRVLRG